MLEGMAQIARLAERDGAIIFIAYYYYNKKTHWLRCSDDTRLVERYCCFYINNIISGLSGSDARVVERDEAIISFDYYYYYYNKMFEWLRCSGG